MTRRLTIAVAAAVLAASSLASEAEAQWAYGWGGWGGWGSATVGGDVTRGMGILAAGMGQYNEQTAVARSIEADTRMRFNEYVWQSEQIRRQQYAQKVAARSANVREAANAIQQRQLYQPSQQDIVSGDSLNAIFHQLLSPGVPHSVLVNAGSDLTITGDQIRLVPLRFASKGLVISAHRLSAEENWPPPLTGGPFDNLRKQYQQIVDEARNIPDEEEIPDELIVRAIDVVNQIRTQASERLQGRDFAEAERYLKTLAGMLQLARRADVRQALEAAYKRDEVPLANALLGMTNFNLSFGSANTPEERALYLNTLYPKMADLRQRVAQELGGQIPDQFQANVGQEPPVGAFDKFPWEEVGRREAHGAAPAPDESQR